MDFNEEAEVKKKRFAEEMEKLKEPEETAKEQPAEEKEKIIKETPKSDKTMDLKQASEQAKEKLAEALNKKANATISISREGEGWLATVEIIDEEYLPGKNLESMNDILGIYEVKLSANGELSGWSKKSSRKRGDLSKS